MTDDQRAELAAGLDAIAAADKATRFLEVYSCAFNLSVMELDAIDHADAIEQLVGAGLACGLQLDVVQAEIVDGLRDGRAACQPAPAVVVPAVPAVVPAARPTKGRAGKCVKMRTNADKRRCIEIALAEFPKLASNQIAELCGVARNTVIAFREASGCQIDKVTGADGKQYPARREKQEPQGA